MWSVKCEVRIFEEFLEYKDVLENKYGIINENVCNTCFSDKNLNIFSSDAPFNDFLMCPKHKNTSRIFECTKSITPDMVIERIDQILNEKAR